LNYLALSPLYLEAKCVGLDQVDNRS